MIVAVGLFAVRETLFTVARHRFEPEEMSALKGSKWMSKEDWKRSWMPWLRGTALGFPIGALPAGGSHGPRSLNGRPGKAVSLDGRDLNRKAWNFEIAKYHNSC